jgi:hypothetical protein
MRFIILIVAVCLAGCATTDLLRSAEETGATYAGAVTGEQIDSGVALANSIGEITGLVECDGAGDCAAATAGTDYYAPGSDIILDDGDGSSPTLYWKIETGDKYVSASMDGTSAQLSFDGDGHTNFGFYTGTSSDFLIVPRTDGYGLKLFDVGANTFARLSVPDGTSNLKVGGTGFLMDTDSKITHADGDLMTFKTAAGVPYVYLSAPLENIATIDLDAATDYLVGGAEWLDDTKGNGDTGFLWSADKIYDQLALKQNTSHEAEGSNITEAVNITTADLGKRKKFTAAVKATLPAAASTSFYGCVAFRIRDGAEEATIDVQDAEKINLNGTAQAAGVGIQATGAGQTVVMCPTTDTDGSGTDGWESWGATSGWASE